MLKLGFLARTPRGRVAMRAAYEHLDLPWRPPEAGSATQAMAAQASLFAAADGAETGPLRPT